MNPPDQVFFASISGFATVGVIFSILTGTETFTVA
jgi:hypothetical protein